MPPLPLAGLRIVVTRPRDQALGLSRGIEQAGGVPLLFPLLHIGPAPDSPELREQIGRLPQFHLAIFISPSAVAHGLAAIRNAGAIPPSLRFAAVGQGSAKALRSLGIPHVIAPTQQFDSEALLALPELQDVGGWHVMIFRGNGGRELLGDTLAARGALVEYATCYQRIKPPLDTDRLLASQPDAVTVSSSEALQHLWDTLDEGGRARLTALPLFAPHERIAAKARSLGWRNVVTTAGGDEGLLAGLCAWGAGRTAP